jgi:hypothetical protein
MINANRLIDSEKQEIRLAWLNVIQTIDDRHACIKYVNMILLMMVISMFLVGIFNVYLIIILQLALYTRNNRRFSNLYQNC